MGICSSQLSKKNGNFLSWRGTVSVVQSDGTLQELNQPITAGQVLTHHPNHFLASSETMYVDSLAPQVPYEAHLELGHIYFLLPVSQSHKVLSLQDLCGLAIKASLALGLTNIKRSDSNVAKMVTQARNSCLVLTAFDVFGSLYPQARRGGQTIKLSSSGFDQKLG